LLLEGVGQMSRTSAYERLRIIYGQIEREHWHSIAIILITSDQD
jgi:hypothetical protein